MHFARELWAVLKWCNILGLLPSYNYKKQCFVPHRGYTFFVHCILGVMYLLLLWRSIVYNLYLPMQIVFVSLIVFSTMVQNVKLSIWNVSDLSRLFYEIDQLDLKLLQRYRLDVVAQEHTTGICVILNVLNALVNFSPFFTEKIDGFAVLESFFDYLFATQLTLQLFILHGICKRSRCVTGVVLDQNKNLESDFMENIAVLQRNVSRIADTYNDLFGWNSFLQIMGIFGGILFTLYTYIAIQGTAEAAKMLLPYFIVIGYQLIHLLFLSMKGQAICKDSDKIISSCCELLKNSRTGQNHNRAMGLLQQVSVKQATISAAGFFDVNFPMLFFLINLSVTYIIALVQLMPN